MSQKRKKKQPPPANISIKGGVTGDGNVVGNNSQSNVSITTSTAASSSTHKSGSQLLWVRLVAFLIALAGILGVIGLFVRLLEAIEPLLIGELVLAGLISALGISGVLKPKLLADLFAKLFGKS